MIAILCWPIAVSKAASSASSHAVSRLSALQVDQKNQEHELIIAEFERMKQSNMRLEITCKDYQEKILASESIVSNYKAIQEENRLLYNQVQDLRGNIRVFCRYVFACTIIHSGAQHRHCPAGSGSYAHREVV